ncbi:hypothetical protein GCM10025883_26770 [Mobilicoccus caccae]|uniref:NADH-quinone oxidoreductase subunit I n=1 Tax=Mobilicoccus caccae TaxID=1859295 RepID=A0ABQ6IRU2_9MICO|nr:hypothetical protein GCM10025883_26770 [Mobilicoccus caccae]
MAESTPTPEENPSSDVARREQPSTPSVYGPEQQAAEQQGGFLSDLLAPVAGFGVSFANQFRKRETEEYPEEKRPTQPRYHGQHQLNRHPDGLEKCVGCELCAWACPADAIFVEGADNDDTPVEQGGTGRYSPGERYGRVYQINYLRCIFCGLCIEACPTRALTMTNFYELADHTREDLIFEKHQLLAPCRRGWSPRRTRWWRAWRSATTTRARWPRPLPSRSSSRLAGRPTTPTMRPPTRSVAATRPTSTPSLATRAA